MKEDLEYVSLPAGMVLNGTYQIIETLNVSDLSIVYKGCDLGSKEEIVLKEYFPKRFVLRDLDGKTIVCKRASQNEKYLTLLNDFLIESKIIKSLKHKNIEQHIDNFLENNTGYIAVKYYEGKTIDKYIKEEKDVNIEDFLYKIFIPILRAVRHMHRRGIIHRDIKPSNIILTKEGIPIIIDFGSAIYYKEKKDKKIFVTSGYSPLEFYSEKSIQGKFSDIYSIAATLYYYLCGMTPPDSPGRVIEDGLEDIRKYNEEIMAFLSWIVMKSLAVNYEKRFKSLRLFSMAIYLQWVMLKVK